MATLRKNGKNQSIFSRQVTPKKEEPKIFDYFDPMAVTKVTETGRRLVRKLAEENPDLFKKETDGVSTEDSNEYGY